MALRVEGKTGLGAFDLPKRLIGVSGEKTGKSPLIWQTADYADAEQRLIIRYSGGVGRFRLETVD